METNSRGNQVERSFLPTERYRWDFDEKLTAAGWEQYDTDQDAWYFGVWVNKKTLQIRSYAEGDITLVTCPDVEHFNAEIKSMNEFYGEGFIAKTIDESGITVYRQDRNQFFIKGGKEVKDGSVLQ
jgi:hypothetical protein